MLVCGGLVTFGVYKLSSTGKDIVPQKTEQQMAQEEAKKQPSADKKKDTPDNNPRGQKPADDNPPIKKPAEDQSPPGKVLDVSFIHPACNAAFVIQPARIAKSKSPLLPSPEARAKLIEQGIQVIGLDFSKIEQIIVVLEPAPSEQRPRPGTKVTAPFTGSGIIRFSEPVDGMEVLAKFLRQMDAAKAGGKTYYRSKTEKMSGEPSAGHFDGERTILLGPESAIQKMLAAKNAQSPLRDRLRELSLENDVFGVMLTEPIKPLLKGLFLSPQAKRQFPTAETLDEDLIAVKTMVNLEGEKLVQMVLEGQNDASTKNLEELVDRGINLAKVYYPELKPRLQPLIALALPPDTVAKIVKVADQFQKKDGITVSREGKNVVVTLHKPKDL